MIVYHGSNMMVSRPDVYHSYRNLDFGKGFYVTSVREQAERWVRRKAVFTEEAVDILCLDRKKERAVFCECKYKNRPMPMEEYDDLADAVKAFPNVKEYTMAFFSKSGYTQPVKERAEKEGAVLMTLDDIYGERLHELKT